MQKRAKAHTQGQGAIEYLLIIGAAILVVAIATGVIMIIIQQGQTQNVTGVTNQDNTYTGLKNLTGKTQITLGQQTVLTITEKKELSTFVSLPDNSTITLGVVKYTKTNGTWTNPSTVIPAGSTIIVYAPGSGTIDLEVVSTTKPSTTISCSLLGTGVKTISSGGADYNVYCGKSGKMWSKVAASTMLQPAAISYCDSLVYAGFDDWHLPGCTTKNYGSGCEMFVFGMDMCDWNDYCGTATIWTGSTYTYNYGTPSRCYSSPICTTIITTFDAPTLAYYWTSETSTYVHTTSIVAGRVYYYPPGDVSNKSVRCVR